MYVYIREFLLVLMEMQDEQCKVVLVFVLYLYCIEKNLFPFLLGEDVDVAVLVFFALLLRGTEHTA